MGIIPRTATGHLTRARRLARSLLPGRDTPLTLCVLALVALTTIALRWGAPGDADVMQWASTNLVNLDEHPVRAMFASLLVNSGGLPTEAAVYAIAGAVLERRSGRVRAAVIPLVGHVIATLVTEGAVRIAIWSHTEARAAAWQLDTGISYAALTAAAAATRYLPRRLRPAGLAGLGAWVLVPLAEHADMTRWGHLLSVLIGLLSWHWVRSPASASTCAAVAPARRPGPFPAWWRAASWGKSWSAAAIIGLGSAGLIFVTAGGPLLPATSAPVVATTSVPVQHRIVQRPFAVRHLGLWAAHRGRTHPPSGHVAPTSR